MNPVKVFLGTFDVHQFYFASSPVPIISLSLVLSLFDSQRSDDVTHEKGSHQTQDDKYQGRPHQQNLVLEADALRSEGRRIGEAQHQQHIKRSRSSMARTSTLGTNGQLTQPRRSRRKIMGPTSRGLAMTWISNVTATRPRRSRSLQYARTANPVVYIGS